MRVGLFTDTYRPSINGIVFVVESLKRELEALGHDVYVFCPAKSMNPAKQAELLNEDPDSHIIRFRSIKGAFFDDYDTSVFFPPAVQRRIKELELDIVHIFTPSQIGLVGVSVAHKQQIPLVIQHCTDMYEFAEHYPAVLPGILTLAGVVLPLSIKLRGRDLFELVKLYRPRGITKWNRAIIECVITILYSKADAVIALSRKSVAQLSGWQDDGDFEYRKKREAMAAESKYADRIIFTGALPREELGVAYQALDVFCFPSLKDTQGWVLHEAAHARKPIIIIDTQVSEVVRDGVNGIFVKNRPKSMADAIITLLRSPARRARFGAESKKLAATFTERRQVRKLEKLYRRVIAQKAAAASRDLDRAA